MTTPSPVIFTCCARMGQPFMQIRQCSITPSHFGGRAERRPARTGLHARIWKGLREERQEAFARGKPFELEQRALGKDGNYRWFLVRYNPFATTTGTLFAGMRLGTDIEDRKRARRACVTKTLRSGSKSITRSCLRNCGLVTGPAKPCSPVL